MLGRCLNVSELQVLPLNPKMMASALLVQLRLMGRSIGRKLKMFYVSRGLSLQLKPRACLHLIAHAHRFSFLDVCFLPLLPVPTSPSDLLIKVLGLCLPRQTFLI